MDDLIERGARRSYTRSPLTYQEWRHRWRYLQRGVKHHHTACRLGFSGEGATDNHSLTHTNKHASSGSPKSPGGGECHYTQPNLERNQGGGPTTNLPLLRALGVTRNWELRCSPCCFAVGVILMPMTKNSPQIRRGLSHYSLPRHISGDICPSVSD